VQPDDLLTKEVRDQRLDLRQLDIVFQATVVRQILYALQLWGPFLSKELSGRISAFLKRSYRYGFATVMANVENLLVTISLLLVYLFQLVPLIFTYLRADCPCDVTTFLDLTSFRLLTGSGRVGSWVKNPDPVPSMA